MPYAIYRDASGKILGSTGTGLLAALVLAPGDSAGSLTVTDWMPVMDSAHIEVYLYTTTIAV